MTTSRWTLIAVCLGTFMLLLDITVVNVALPDIQRELHASFTDLQWVVDAYSLMLASVCSPPGRWQTCSAAVACTPSAWSSSASLRCSAGSPARRRCSTSPRGFQGIGGAVMFASPRR